jgi:hypothetical protein
MIKRYQDYEAGIHEHFLCDYVKYEDHLAIVEKLKADVAQLERELDGEYERGYDNGYSAGNKVGYLQGLMGED